MRKLLATLLAFTTLSASAQQPAQQPVPPPPAGSNWQHVQALPVGTSLYVNAKPRHTACKLKSDDADTLTCTSSGKDVVFQRTEIVTIKISRRGRSALIAAAPGAALAIGGGIGFATCNEKELLGCLGPGAAVGTGSVIALIGALTGGLTDFTRSTVYKAP
jgi:hypothetical protein